jgi:hypothetical protein
MDRLSGVAGHNGELRIDRSTVLVRRVTPSTHLVPR